MFTAYNAVYDKQGIIVTSQAMGEYVMREFILIANFLRESFLREYFLGEYFMKEHFIEPITNNWVVVQMASVSLYNCYRGMGIFLKKGFWSPLKTERIK